MEYDIENVKKDILVAKNKLVESNFDITQFAKIGKGGNSHGVFEYGSAAIKWETENPDYIEKYMKKSELGIARGYHFAPILDYVHQKSTESIFSFMPKLFGKRFKPNATKPLAQIGKGGIEEYFGDWLGLAEIDFNFDLFGDNMRVGNTNIYFFDMGHGNYKTESEHLYDATREVLNASKPMCDSNEFIYAKNVAQAREVNNNAIAVLEKFKHINAEALNMASKNMARLKSL